MKRCEDLYELLYEYAAGELDAEVKQLVDKHLQGCDSCEAYIDSYRKAVVLARGVPEVPPPPELLKRLLEALEEEEELQGEDPRPA